MGEQKQKISKAVRLKYNILARIYDLIYRNYIKTTIQSAVASLNLVGQERLLDIGCGTGELEKALLKKMPSLNIVGIDISDDMLEKARNKLSQYPNVHLITGDFLNTEIPGNEYDVAFSLSNLHYFSNPIAVFKKVSLLLKSGGQFVIIDWDRNSFKGRLYNWYMNKADPSFTKTYSMSEAIEMLQANGFKTVQSDGFKVRFVWVMMRLVSKKA